MMDAKEAKLTLESFVDKWTMADVVGWLSEIAVEKAEHVIVNWQDKTTAKAWTKTATILHKTADAVEAECC